MALPMPLIRPFPVDRPKSYQEMLMSEFDITDKEARQLIDYFEEVGLPLPKLRSNK